MTDVAAGNLFDDIPMQLDEELFTTLVQREGMKIQRIVSTGQASPASGWYDQHDHEWVVVLSGEATVIYDSGEVFQLGPGAFLNIPAHTRHRVSWTMPGTDTVWLAIHYA